MSSKIIDLLTTAQLSVAIKQFKELTNAKDPIAVSFCTLMQLLVTNQIINLDLRGLPLDNLSMKILIEAIKTSKSIQGLTLPEITVDGMREQCQSLLHAIQENGKLSSLALETIGGADANALAMLLNGNTQLRKLSVSAASAAFQTVLPLLNERNTTLSDLEIHCEDQLENGVGAFLAANRTLTRFAASWWSNVNICQDDVPLIGKNTTLKELSVPFVQNDIPAQLLRACPSLQSLGDKFMVTCTPSPAQSEFFNLTNLSVVLTCDSIQPLIDVLATTQLRSLALYRATEFLPSGDELWHAIADNRSLTKLMLFFLSSVSPLLLACASLESLEMSNITLVGDDFIDALPNATNLTALRLEECEFDQTLMTLALLKHKNLESVTLAHTWRVMRTNQVENLCLAAAANKRLKTLVFELPGRRQHESLHSKANELAQKNRSLCCFGFKEVCEFVPLLFVNRHRADLNRALITELALIFCDVFPPYVLLEVVDQLDSMRHGLKHHVKVEKIIAIFHSIRQLRADRHAT